MAVSDEMGARFVELTGGPSYYERGTAMEAPALPEAIWAAVHRAAAGEAWPPASEETFDAFLAQASREGLLPLLFHQAGLPPSVRARLDARAALLRLAVARARLVRHAVASLARILQDEPFVVLKGADYMVRLYPRPELRPMQDVDLLVPLDRIDAACDRLAGAGLVRRPVASGPRAAPSYYERAFLLGDVIVEVHHSFVQRSRHRVDYPALWRRRVPAPDLGPSAARLEAADAVAYHALALAKDEFTAPLVRYVDFWRMLRLWPDALPAAAGRARDWRTARALYGALRQAARFFPELDGGEAATIARSLVGPGVRAFLDRCVLPPAHEQGRAGVVTRRRQLWRKFWLMDGIRARAGFALAHMGASVAGQRRSAPPGLTRIALFGSGSPTSTLALDTLAARFDVALVVVPGGPRRGGVRGVLRRVGRWRSRRTLARAARRLGIPVHVSVKARPDGLVSTLHQHRVDLICVATFPHRIPDAVLRAVPLGAIGLHPSLLPRHRGPDPLFWTYHEGDPEAGVSVFALDGGEDTGDLLAQEALPVERGRPGIDLYHELARRGASLLVRAVDDLAAGRAARSPQIEARATREPAPPSCRVALAEWDAERLWHFLRGVGDGLLVDAAGRRVLHGPVRGWAREPAGAPGEVQIVDAALRLYCREGWVDVERAPLALRLRGALRGGVRA